MASSIFERERSGIREDRRTWALFLALERSKELRSEFVTTVLKLEDGDIHVETWPSGFGNGEPDGIIWCPGRWVALFEAKAGNNPLRSEQIERYCRYLTSQMNKTNAKIKMMITLTEDRDVPTDVVDLLRTLEVPHVHLSLQRLQQFLRRVSTEASIDFPTPKIDSVARFVAGELLTYVEHAANKETPEMLTRLELEAYGQHHQLIHKVRAQFQERVEQVKAQLQNKVEVDKEDISGGVQLCTGIAGSPLYSGLVIDIARQQIEWFVLLNREQFLVGDEVLEPMLVKLGWRRVRNLRDGNSYWAESIDGLDAWLDPHEFESTAASIAERFHTERTAILNIWPAFAAECVAHALPEGSRTLAPIMRNWIQHEASAERKISMYPDHIEVVERGGVASWLKAYWDRDSLSATSKLVLDAQDAQDIKAVGWSPQNGKNGRSVSIRGVDHLRQALQSVKGL